MSFSEWKEVNLGDVVDTISQKHKLDKEKVILVNTSDVFEGEVLKHEYVPNKDLKGQFKKSFQKYDILYSEIRPKNKRFAYIDFDSEEYVASTKLMVLRKKSNKITSDFLYQVLKSDDIINRLQVIAESRSGTFPQITFTELSRLNIMLPPINEQLEISTTLFSLDDKIELNNRINKNLEKIAQTIFKHWFVDFEFPNEEGLPYKSSGGEMVDSELGMIPKRWKAVALADICYFNNETYSSKDKFDYINYLDTSNITENKVDTIQKIDCSSEKVPSRAKRKIIKDSIVYSTVRPNQLHYGIIKKPVKNMIASTGFVVINSKLDFIKNDLVYLWLTQDGITTKLQAIAETSTSTYPSIKPSDIKYIKIVLPNKEILDNISNLFCEINLQIAALQEQNKNLSSVRDTLLPKLMNGEIDLSKLEINQ